MCEIPIKKINVAGNMYGFNQLFTIQDVHAKLNGKAMVEPLHRHDFYFMLALEKGFGQHEIDFKTYEVKNYTLFFIKPGQVHQLTLEPESKGYLLNFSANLFHANNSALSHLLHKVASQNYYVLSQNFFEKVMRLLHDIYCEHLNKGKGHEEIISAILHIIFIQIERDYHEQKNKANNYVQERFEEFSQLLEHHITQRKQVSEYAAMMNLSTYQLNAIVKTVLDKTCSEVIKEYVVLEAKRYLLATSDQINQIALMLGYEDVSYFIRFFKNQTSYSPKVFRQNFTKVH